MPSKHSKYMVYKLEHFGEWCKLPWLLQYASPSWREFRKSDHTSKNKAIISKARLYVHHFVKFPSFEKLLEDNDEALFRSTLDNHQHVLRQLLSPPKQTGYNLRSRGHVLTFKELQFEYLSKILFIACCTKIFINFIVCLRALRSVVWCVVALLIVFYHAVILVYTYYIFYCKL